MNGKKAKMLRRMVPHHPADEKAKTWKEKIIIAVDKIRNKLEG